MGVGLILLMAEDPGHERAKLFEHLEAGRRAGRDMLHAARDVGGIRVGRKLHDESAARGDGITPGFCSRRPRKS